jgi:hypothetical protein
MSPLRDFLLAPRTGEAAVDDRARRTRRARAARPADEVTAPSLGLLAPARDLPAAAAAVGLAIARTAPAALVCLAAPGPSPGLRAPARPAAARLAASLRARGLEASARGRLAFAHIGREPLARVGGERLAHVGGGPLAHVGDEPRAHVGDEPLAHAVDEPLARLPGELLADAATRALAAAGPLPTLLAVAARDDAIDALLATRDAMLVALPPSAEPALARLALAGALELVARAGPLARAVPLPLALDPLQRTLAVAGFRAPRAISAAVAELVA